MSYFDSFDGGFDIPIAKSDDTLIGDHGCISGDIWHLLSSNWLSAGD